MDGFALLILIAAFVLAFIAFNRSAKHEKTLAQLSLNLNKLGDEIEVLRRSGVTAQPQPDFIAEPDPPHKEVPPEAAPAIAIEAANQNTKPRSPPTRDVEQALASRWFVWIGGLAIAIGGVLFVKYAFDSGWISPLLQCVLGFVAGIALVLGGSYLQRTPLMRAQSSYVPAALTAAGLAIAFGSVYAAYAFYQLLPPLVAFLIMGLIGLAAFALSLTQGPLIAGLGLIGSYATPTLIPSENPSAWTFFPYVLIILGASFAVLRKRTWWWLGYAAVAGALAWALLWVHGGIYEPADILPVGLFALAVGSVSYFGIAGRDILLPGSGSLAHVRSVSPPLGIGLAGLLTGALILCANVISSDHHAEALALLLIGAGGAAAVAWFKDGMTRLVIAVAVMSLITIGLWFEVDLWQIAYDDLGYNVLVLGAGASRFLFWTAVFGAAFAAAGYAGTRWRAGPVAWSILASGSAILFGLLGSARAYGVLSSSQWIVVSAVVALAFCAAIWSLRKRAHEPKLNLALGILAIAATAAAAFGLQEAFDRVWLSMALALLVPVLAIAATRFRIGLFGSIATVVAGLVALRLFVAHDLWFGDASLPLGNHWPLYGYGAPAGLFWISSRLFGRVSFDRAAVALEGVALGLAVALVSLELRVIIAGGVPGDEPGLLELAAHAAAWLGAAYGLMHRQAAFTSFISLWGARALIAAATVLIVLGSLFWLNPVVTQAALPGGTIINALILAYLVPAILGAMIVRKLDAVQWQGLRMPGGILVLVLALAYLTLQTKRFFQDTEMVAWATSDAESYAYSAVWLASAMILFVAGIRFDRKYIRLAGLAVMILVVLKVFLVDLAGISGLYRIASFIGLGLCLVGIGWLYTRYVQKPKLAMTEGA